VESKIKKFFKELFHIHRYTTLLMYQPFENRKYYKFLLRCDCGYSKPTKLPRSIKEYYVVTTVSQEKWKEHGRNTK
jgi:hypothetical protein